MRSADARAVSSTGGRPANRYASSVGEIRSAPARKWPGPLVRPRGYLPAPRGRCLGPTLSEARVEATVLLVTGPPSGRLVEVGASARLRPEEDFLSWYAAWLKSADASGVAPREESVLVELLSTADEAERARAVHELGALDALSDGTVGLVGSLALRDPSSKVRYQAVELLGELRDGVDVLVEAVRDGKRSVSRRALVHAMRLAGATPAWREALGIMRSTGDEVGARIAEDLESRRLRGASVPPGGA